MVSASSIILCISILLVFGFVVQCEEVGHGKHVLVNETIIELKNNTRIAENDTDLEQYRKLEGACDVTLDNDGNIILWYSKNSSTIEFGCSVDLVTKNEGHIPLIFGISHSGNLADCITKENSVPDNCISFSYSMNVSEFKELKNGPQEGEVSDCSHETDCKNKGGVCRNTTAFYSVGWMPETNTGNYYYFLQPVGDLATNAIKMKNAQDTTFNLTIKGTEFSFPKKQYKSFSNLCYKNEKLRKAEEWKIMDSNYNNQDFTHLFTFNILPIEAMRQSLQDIYAMCRKSRTAGCKEHATLLKCDKIFVKFDKEYFRMLVPDITTDVQTGNTTRSATTKDGNTTNDKESTLNIGTTSVATNPNTGPSETTTTKYKVNTRKVLTITPKTTVASESGTITIILIILGILIFVTIIIAILIWFFVFHGKGKKEDKKDEEECPPPLNATKSNQGSTNGEKEDHSKEDSKEDSIVDKTQSDPTEERNDPSTVVETQIDHAESLNNPSTVVGTQLDIDVKAGAEVPDSIEFD
uniref:Uncharacterized protein n=1 Tax=Meloidogyne incognita TaxID=6306 RepID=A0A914MKS1_MELIC